MVSGVVTGERVMRPNSHRGRRFVVFVFEIIATVVRHTGRVVAIPLMMMMMMMMMIHGVPRFALIKTHTHTRHASKRLGYAFYLRRTSGLAVFISSRDFFGSTVVGEPANKWSSVTGTIGYSGDQPSMKIGWYGAT